jgi:hypothetical protein
MNQPTTQPLAELRNQLLTAAPNEFGLSPTPEHPRVWCGVMDWGGTASLIGLADGTTSLYFINGGGIIGAGEHEQVAAATHRWLAALDEMLDALERTGEFGIPPEGQVRFIVRTFDETRGATAGEAKLVEGRHRLASLFAAAQDVITEVRLVSEREGA